MNPQTQFIFTSQRLGFRLIQESDFDEYFKLDNNPEVRFFFPNGTLNAEKVKVNMQRNMDFFQNHGFGVFIAIELATGEFVGRCGFGVLPWSDEIEVGYVFMPKFWGKGFATEALIALLNWAKENIYEVDAIIAYTPIEHIASQRVMQKANMEFYNKEIKDEKEFVYYKMKLR